jgi:methyltransferase (TIGR00027 family)
MKSDKISQTAVMVCMARAAAHGTTGVGTFSDPTAFSLLTESERRRVERFRSDESPRGLAERIRHAHLSRESQMIVARTVAIDDAVRAARAPQVVILGAGLDGRAWRMAELERSIVFEVDHPATQREKRLRSEGLKQIAREVHFVPVDFARDNLAAELAAAGHDSTQATIWVWEAVVMYLERRDIESTLRVVHARSTPGSRIVIVYCQPALMLLVLAVIVRRLGEPIRTALTSTQMRMLLERHGFEVRHDEELPTIAAKISSEMAKATKMMKHLRVVIADRL